MNSMIKSLFVLGAFLISLNTFAQASTITTTTVDGRNGGATITHYPDGTFDISILCNEDFDEVCFKIYEKTTPSEESGKTTGFISVSGNPLFPEAELLNYQFQQIASIVQHTYLWKQ